MKTLSIGLGSLLTLTLTGLAFLPGLIAPPRFRPADICIDVLEVAPPPSSGQEDDLRTVHFRIRNRSHLPITLIGTSGLCGRNACLSPKLEGHIEIAPGDSYDLPVELAIRAGATTFKATAPLYVKAANHVHEYELVAQNIGFTEESLPKVP
jgi:hypothetical protein